MWVCDKFTCCSRHRCSLINILLTIIPYNFWNLQTGSGVSWLFSDCAAGRWISLTKSCDESLILMWQNYVFTDPVAKVFKVPLFYFKINFENKGNLFRLILTLMLTWLSTDPRLNSSGWVVFLVWPRFTPNALPGLMVVFNEKMYICKFCWLYVPAAFYSVSPASRGRNNCWSIEEQANEPISGRPKSPHVQSSRMLPEMVCFKIFISF